MSSTPLQNRVDPWGRLNAVRSRGTLMGNRGILHDESGRIVGPWKGKSWVTCLLAFGSVQRTPFSSGTYSELLFVDEATAFSAGHRPCATCQRDRHTLFKQGWFAAHPPTGPDPVPRVLLMDQLLHKDRTDVNGAQRTHDAALESLPEGTLIEHDGAAHLRWQNRLHRWSFDGYTDGPELAGETTVKVLTPATVVNVFKRGFVPRVHESVSRP
jgi:hypothetical protein